MIYLVLILKAIGFGLLGGVCVSLLLHCLVFMLALIIVRVRWLRKHFYKPSNELSVNL